MGIIESLRRKWGSLTLIPLNDFYMDLAEGRLEFIYYNNETPYDRSQIIVSGEKPMLYIFKDLYDGKDFENCLRMIKQSREDEVRKWTRDMDLYRDEHIRLQNKLNELRESIIQAYDDGSRNKEEIIADQIAETSAQFRLATVQLASPKPSRPSLSVEIMSQQSVAGNDYPISEICKKVDYERVSLMKNLGGYLPTVSSFYLRQFQDRKPTGAHIRCIMTWKQTEELIRI